MNQESFADLLQDLCVQSQLVRFEPLGEEKFSATLYCELSGTHNYDEQCAAFIDKFSKETQTNWISSKRYATQVRYLFRKVFACQLSKKNKTNRDRHYVNKIRDHQCTAKIDFKWKQINRATCRNDPVLKCGLNCVVNINFDHSHPVNAAKALVYLRCTKETTEQFHSYFHAGMTPAVAKIFHEIVLINTAEDESCVSANLANGQTNPTLRQVIHLHKTWKKNHPDGNSAFLETLKTRKKELGDLGFHISIHEESSTVAIVTPLMKKVFSEFRDGGVILVDSSDHYPTSKYAMEKNKSFLTFFFVVSKIGALPLGCIMHNLANFQVAFTLLKEALEQCVMKSFCPGVVLTYDCAVQRIALQTTFPTARILLTSTLVRESVWRWLWLTKHNVTEEDRKPIMQCFHRLILAPSTESATETYKELISKLKDYTQALKYFENLWFRRSEWCLSFQRKVLPTGMSTEDCEASIRILKDVFLQRCKNFNQNAFLELVCGPFENYHDQRLADCGCSNMDAKPASHYSKFCRIVSDYEIVEIGLNEFTVHAKGGLFYKVNTEFSACDCSYGRTGRYCDHLCAVEKKLDFWVKSCPQLTMEDKILYSRLSSIPSKPPTTRKWTMFARPNNEEEYILGSTSPKASMDEDIKPDMPEFECCSTELITENIIIKQEPVEEGPACSSMTFEDDPQHCISLPPKKEDDCQDDSFRPQKSPDSPQDGSFSSQQSQGTPGCNNVPRQTKDTAVNIDLAVNIRSELLRLASLLESTKATNSMRLTKFYNTIQSIKTPTQAIRLCTIVVKTNRMKRLSTRQKSHSKTQFKKQLRLADNATKTSKK